MGVTAPRKTTQRRRKAPVRAAHADTAVQGAETQPPAPVRYRALRKMRIDGRQVLPGDPVPEAEEWTRVESWVRAGFIEDCA